jgi:hypothetical protein
VISAYRKGDMAMSKYKHRLVFVGAWLLILVALLVYPGFEVKGLVWGLIIGYWPFVLGGDFVESLAFALGPLSLFFMLVLSGLEVGVCAWLMDKSRLSKFVWIALLVAIPFGFVFFSRGHISYDDWKRTPAVYAAMESPEINYQPTRSDYNEQIVLPRTIAGGMWGLYFTAALGAVWALGLMLLRRYSAGRQNLAEVS